MLVRKSNNTTASYIREDTKGDDDTDEELGRR